MAYDHDYDQRFPKGEYRTFGEVGYGHGHWS